MSINEKLVKLFDATNFVVTRQADGLTHEESLVQLPFRSNCFNWVLGHIVMGRDRALEALGSNPLYSDEQRQRYGTGSEPITPENQALTLEALLAGMDKSREAIAAALESTSEAALAKVWNEESGQTVEDRIRGLHWHETYHSGQLEILRQAAGKDDRILG